MVPRLDSGMTLGVEIEPTKDNSPLFFFFFFTKDNSPVVYRIAC